MEITPELKELIERFWKVQDTDLLIGKQRFEHRRRVETATSLLQHERIPQLTRDEIAAFLQDTDTWYGLKWNKQEFWDRVFGAEEENVPNLRSALEVLLRRAEAGLTAEDFNNLLAFMPGIGPSYLSEMLGLRMADRYWLWNKQVREFFAAQDIDVKADLPRGKKSDEGEEYLAVGKHLADLKQALSEAKGAQPPVDFMTTDLFLFWINQKGKLGDLAAHPVSKGVYASAVNGNLDALLTLERLCQETYSSPDFYKKVEFLLRDKGQIIFYGPPGTGKTFIAKRFARYWVDSALDPGGHLQVVQFHPSYTYEEFIEGIRPRSRETSDGHTEISYPVRPGVFRRFCEAAREFPDRNYVLILDEINRGELPRILGELLYLLEYRREKVILPYSGDPLGIPENLYILGTMNTADRSIALVDHALRRRFHFVDLRPQPEVVRAYFESRGQTEWLWLEGLLSLVNQKLHDDGIQWHSQIGHSYFMRPDLDEGRLQLIWDHSIYPTLEEYFYRQSDEHKKTYDLRKLRAELGRM